MDQFYVRLGYAKKRRRGLGRLHHFVAVMLESEILEETRDAPSRSGTAIAIWSSAVIMKQSASYKSCGVLDEQLDELSGVLASQGRHLAIREHFDLLVRRNLK